MPLLRRARPEWRSSFRSSKTKSQRGRQAMDMDETKGEQAPENATAEASDDNARAGAEAEPSENPGAEEAGKADEEETQGTRAPGPGRDENAEEDDEEDDDDDEEDDEDDLDEFSVHVGVGVVKGKRNI